VRYLSTRGRAPALSFEDVLLAGLARDGGLYVPETWPALGPDWHRLAGLDYADLAVEVMRPYLGGAFATEFGNLVADAYRGFGHAAVAPLVQIGPNEFLLELFHGPTLAFKDFALQLLGRLLDTSLRARGARATVLGATSGDTGSAAIEALAGKDAVEVFMLHPKGRTSAVQRMQMTTVTARNVHNVAVEGTFDDCQALVKGAFNDLAFRDRFNLSAVNSINWTRVLGQIVYYVYAALRLGAPHRPVAFAVPTGNFGDVYAGYAAANMGLPVDRLIVATNRNDIVARALATGDYSAGRVEPTISPSMDIQVASNFERLMFDLEDRDGDRVSAMMAEFDARRAFRLSPAALERARALFLGAKVDEDQTRATIARVFAETGEVIDPHTAVGVAAARAHRPDPSVPVVVLATAHPAKFPEAVEAATGVRPPLPRRMADLMERPERYVTLPNDLQSLQSHILAVTEERR
jgi:threonine synthase